MKIETILNAYDLARFDLFIGTDKGNTRARQKTAFRARILRTAAIYRNFAEANGFDKEQAWFWTDEWQAAEKEVDQEIT